MDYVNLGRTGVKISRLILGGGNFGGIGSSPAFFGQGETEEEAFRLMDAAVDIGVNVIDTADAYGGGRSEEMIGRWLKTKGSHVRDQLLMSSKVFNPVGDGPNDWGLSRRHIMRQVQASIRRLGVDHLDLYLIHEPDPTTPLEETLRALDDLVRQGTVRYLGASNMPAWLTARSLWLSDKLGLYRFEWIQNSYSLLERGDEKELFPLLADQALGYTPFSPLAGGWLTGKYRRDAPYPEGSRMTMRPEPYLGLQREAIYRGTRSPGGVTPPSAGSTWPRSRLAWLLASPRVTAAILGPRRPEQLQPGLRALDMRLDSDERRQISDYFTE